MSKLELSLVENAFDFFMEAIDQINQTNPKKRNSLGKVNSTFVQIVGEEEETEEETNE